MGLYFEEFVTGAKFDHGTWVVTQEENASYCKLTQNTQPLHLDEEYARSTQFGRIVVNGLLTFSTAVGRSVPQLTEGTLVANLGYDEVRHPNPVFPGDKLSASSTVLDVRTSSKPGRGVVTIQTEVYKLDQLVCSFKRVALVKSRNA